MAKKEARELAKEVRVKTKTSFHWGLDDMPFEPIYENPDNPNEWDGFKENQILPKLCFYMRVSKKSPSQSNIASQEKALLKLYSFFAPSHFYPDDKTLPLAWGREFLIGKDEYKSGSIINSGLKKFLDDLYFQDAILVQDISRFTRMELKSEEFRYLHRKLYEQDRLVYILAPDNMPLQISKNIFLDFAQLSNEEYEELRTKSAKGNEVKSRTKKLSMELCQKYYEKDFTHKMIASLLRKKIPTVKGYIAELRKQGKLTRFGRAKFSNFR